MKHPNEFLVKEEETIRIPLSLYLSLKRGARMLETLEAYGVDSWVWYEDALEYFKEEDGAT